MFAYDVAISFAGEQRREAEAIANCLRAAGITVFYDAYEQANLWGKDIHEHLDTVYRQKAQYCLMLVSAAYAAKVWTTHERRSAQARALTQNIEYILPVRFDDTEIPGLLPTIGYLRFHEHGVEGICKLLLQKLRATQRVLDAPASISTSPRAYILDPEQDLQAWVPVTESTWGKTEATIVLQPDDPADPPFLDSLRGTRSQLLIAFKHNAGLCHVEDVHHVQSAGTDHWSIRLRIERSDFAPSMEISMPGLTADQIAEQRARRILLNEHPARDTNDWNEAAREVALRGMQTPLQAKASPFPALYDRYGRDPLRFLEIAWITGAMALKTTGAVAEVTTLRLALDATELRVDFTGKRRKQYVNAPATIITVSGTCRLAK